jgi:hypothetical protein
MKRILVGLALIASAATGLAASKAPSASSAPAAVRADVLIRHAYFGCHVWSVNGNREVAAQKLSIRAGGLVTVTNHDGCLHTLVQLAGPTDAWIGSAATGERTDGVLVPYGPPVAVKLVHPGTYVFGTVAGEHGLTIAEKAGDAASAPDYDLTLTVRVLPTID